MAPKGCVSRAPTKAPTHAGLLVLLPFLLALLSGSFLLLSGSMFVGPSFMFEPLEETEIHVSIESWIGSYKAQFEQMSRNLPESAALDLGSLGSLEW